MIRYPNVEQRGLSASSFFGRSNTESTTPIDTLPLPYLQHTAVDQPVGKHPISATENSTSIFASESLIELEP